MRMTHRFITLFALLVLLLVPSQTALAKGASNGQVVFGGTYTLKSGEALDGDLVILGGSATVEEDATVNGDVVLVGGSLRIDGEINGDIVLVGGFVNLGEKSLVSGDMVTVGGSVNRAEGARVEGQTINGVPGPVFNIPALPSTPPKPQAFTAPKVNVNFNAFGRLFWMFFRSVAVAALAMLLVMFLEVQTRRVAQAITDQPLIAGGIGLLTIVLAPLVLLLLVITLILIPVAALVAFALALAWLFGVIALGIEVGRRFTQMIGQEWAAVLAAGFGTFLLMISGEAISMVPCIGWLAPFLVAVVGVGGVVMTLFGTRPYPILPAPAPTAESDTSK
jgi:hypothetical protein